MVKTNLHAPPMGTEITILALGERFSLYGDNAGHVGRICSKCLAKVKAHNPMRVYIEDADFDLFGFAVALSTDVPTDTVLAFELKGDREAGLAVYASFDPVKAVWYVREILDGCGKPTGRFFGTAAEYQNAR